jgi:CBS domain-containing protein
MGRPVEGRKKSSVLADFMHADAPRCRRTDRARDVVDRMPADPPVVSVVSEGGVLLGSVDRSALQYRGDSVVETLMAPAPPTRRPHEPVEDTLQFMTRHQLEHVLVTTADGELLGLARRTELARALERSDSHDAHV